MSFNFNTPITYKLICVNIMWFGGYNNTSYNRLCQDAQRLITDFSDWRVKHGNTNTMRPPAHAWRRGGRSARQIGQRWSICGRTARRPRPRPLQPVRFQTQGGLPRCRARLSPGGLRSLCRCAVSPAAARKGAAGEPVPQAVREFLCRISRQIWLTNGVRRCKIDLI